MILQKIYILVSNTEVETTAARIEFHSEGEGFCN